MNEIYEIYKKNFPYIYREEETLKNIIGDKNNIKLEKRNENNELIGISLINENTILLLCVDEKYRNKGIGSELLSNSEEIIKNNGYDKAKLGAGKIYLMPGVPTSKRYFNAENEKLYDFLDTKASDFFEKRGYKHFWDCNCFDMFLELRDFTQNEFSIGDTINGIIYRWANIDDYENVLACVSDAQNSFTNYYKDKLFYDSENNSKILVAEKDGEIAGTLLVSIETEGKDLGSPGITSVKHKFRGQHIGVNLIRIGTKYLKDIGLKYANLSYTYSGMDHLYGYADYKISTYYMMGEKKI